MNAKHVRLLRAAALTLAASSWMVTADAADGTRFTYAGAAYEWTDVLYAMKQEGSDFDGYNLEASVGLLPWLHVFGQYWDGNLSGGGINKDTKDYQLGAGVSYPVSKTIDLIGNAAWAHAELDSVSDDGYIVEGMARLTISDNAAVSVSDRYTDISGSDISNNDVILALEYNVTSQFSLRATGIVFDDDPGFSLGVRWYFDKMLGRDSLF
jgi:hypothetical protein